MSPKIETYTTGISDGSSLKYKRYPERVITVQYQLITDSPKAFREAYNKLAAILDVEDAELIFNDEQDKFFIGTPSVIGEIEPGRNSVVGEFEILCVDPFKYSVTEYEVEAENLTMTADDGSTYTSTAFVVDYNGTYKSFPTFVGEFYEEIEDGVNETTLTGDGDCGFLAFYNEEGKIIQLGNPEELDKEAVEKSQTLINQSFQKSISWGAEAQKLWAVNSGIDMFYEEAQVGTVGTVASMPNAPDGVWFMSAKDYGTSNAERYGPSITRAVPADAGGEIGASNFSLSFYHKQCPSKGAAGKEQCGIFYALVVSGSDASRKILAGVRIAKYSVGDDSGKVEFFVNGKAIHTKHFPFTHNNQYFGVGGTQHSTITKSGNTVNFNIGGIGYSFTCYDAGFDTEKATETTFMFACYGGNVSPLAYNGVTTVKFVKNNCTAYKDIPNKFSGSDIVKANCRTGEILLNGLSKSDLGALGNDWEHFYLKPGVNQIGVSYSDWLADEYAPTLKMRYREVFL